MSFQELYKVVARSNQIDQRRLQYTIYVCWILTPVLLVFPLFNSYSNLLSLIIIGILLAILLGQLLINSSAWFFGVSGLGYAAIALLYFVYLGYADGGSVMWIFVFPMLAIFLTGLLYGVIAGIVVLGIAGSMMMMGSDINAYDYSTGFTVRFVLSYSLIMGLASAFEFWRIATELQKEQLDQKLEQTQDALKKLTSVCAWCSSIRNDDGDWQTLESYIEKTEESAITHAICPGCQAKEMALKND